MARERVLRVVCVILSAALAGWLKHGKGTAEVVARIYLTTLSRSPTSREKELVSKHLAAVTDKTAGLHALLNLNEFLLRR